jgi:hypothetical protein
MSKIRTLTAVTELLSGVTYTASALEQKVKMPWRRRQSSIDYRDSPGAWDPRGRGAAALEARTIDAELTIVYDGTTTDFTAAWRAFLLGPGGGRQVRLTFVEPDGVSWYADAKCTGGDMETSTDYFSYCVIPASFFLASPYLYLPDGTLLADTGLLADAGLVADGANPTVAITSNTATLTFSNAGTLPSEGSVIHLDGPLTGPIRVGNANVAVVNPETGIPRFFFYLIGVAAGETVTIDNATGDVTSTLLGPVAYQYFAPDNVSESYLPIGPGSNVISVTTGSAVGQNGRITIVYKPLTL